jgi:cytochrome c-type biogenesis protein CcsB
MKKFLKFLFSMPMMGILIFIFWVSIGTATFIENDFGTQAAKALVYNARWFEILLALIAINLVANIFRYQLYKREKWSIFIFHIAFIIIFIGSALTRYVGFEGSMHIREGAATNQMTSTESFIDIKINKAGQQVNESSKLNLSAVKSTKYNESFQIDNQEIDVSLTTFIPNASTTIIQEAGGVPILELIAIEKGSMMGMQTYSIEYNGERTIGNRKVIFGKKEIADAIQINITDSLRIKSPVEILEGSMMGGSGLKMNANTWHVIQPQKIYEIEGTKYVLKKFYASAKYKYVQGEDKNAPTMLAFEISTNNKKRELIVKGQNNYVGTPATISIGGTEISIAYGAKILEVPFMLRLNKFQLDRYPGSNSPSSYASEVTLIDQEENVKFDYRIYMNHILKHRGYRFFQSSYDTDEKGTVLSVNHDRWGMTVTYIGYFLLFFGMAWALFQKGTRFKWLGKQIRKQKSFVLLFALFLGGIYSVNAQELKVVPKEQAKSFGEIVVQDNGGRFEPVNTLASEVIRKITKKGKFKGYPAEQVFLSMVAHPQDWQTVKMIKVGNKDLAKEVGVTGKYAAFTDFLDERGQYKLGAKVQAAYNKKPVHQNKYDKEIIAVDERVNVIYMVFTGEFLKIFPDPKDSMHEWYSPTSQININGDDSLFIKKSVVMLGQSLAHNQIDMANNYIDGIKKYQAKFGSEVMPSKAKLKTEILYNNINIFKRLFPFYLIVGFLLIVFLITHLLRPNFPIRGIMKGAIFILGVFFLLHSGALAARWYIAGHAPWSNGFESMTYVAWSCILAGFIFVRKSNFALAATSILAGLTLFVAHLSWMNPEVTNLVPVLKSYWLTIHVAVITSSYAFLALALLLGLINLILYIFMNDQNYERLKQNITDLSRISEMTMTIGLYFLTIGTFLGGIWANESWGRYWGWDPKETWALVSILVYSFVLHMRFIPGLKSIFAFNIASVWAYASILMTYFGVNYYLAGLHSYAKGDPVPVPTWVYYTIASIIVIGFAAYFNKQKYSRIKDQ